MSRRVLGLGYGWDDERPHLRVRGLFDDVPEQLVLQGRLRFRLEPGRLCVGSFDGERDVPCPTRAVARRGTQCEACQARDAFRPCMTCDGSRCPRLTPAMTRRCRQEHVLYLACFGDEAVKVGTATVGRRVRRVVEQGPLAAAWVARAEGPTIKQMEHLLAQGAFTETMRRGRKTELLQGSMTEHEAEERVRDAFDTLSDRLPLHYRPHLIPPTFVAQPALARASRALSVLPLQLADDVIVEGEVVGAVGHVVFLRDLDGTFALDLGELKARVLEVDPEEGGRRPVVQLGLFG